MVMSTVNLLSTYYVLLILQNVLPTLSQSTQQTFEVGITIINIFLREGNQTLGNLCKFTGNK